MPLPISEHLPRTGSSGSDASDDHSHSQGSSIRRAGWHPEGKFGSKAYLGGLVLARGMTAHQLLKAFRLCFDTSPAQFVIDKVLGRARWLRPATNHDVAQIALEAGFKSHSHLTATTRKRYGITPQE